MNDEPTLTTNPEGEIWSGTPSQWQNFWWFLSCILLLPIPVALWKWLVIKNYRITLTGHRLRIRTGVFSKENEDIELYRMKDWSLTQPFIQRILRKGTVEMHTSDRTAPTLILKWLDRPANFVEHLRQVVEEVRDRKRVRELDMGFGDGAEVSMD